MMADFKKEIIKILERNIPDLKGKIQAGAVDAETPVPYAVFDTPEETPIRTIHGIAAMAVQFELAVFHNKISAVEALKTNIINALDSVSLSGRRCIYKSSQYGFYADYNIHGYSMNFKIV